MIRRPLVLAAVSLLALVSLNTACGRFGPPQRIHDREEAAAEAAPAALEGEPEEEENP